jgi:octaprenyl-diphosphate synthase
MRKVGECIGMSFQIKDDLFDYGDKDVGKPLGIDIKEKKMTLPLIYALNNTDYFKRKKIIYIIKNHSNDDGKVQEVIDFVKNSEGIKYTQSKLLEYRNKAIDLIDELPNSQASEHLKKLVDFVITRNQ